MHDIAKPDNWDQMQFGEKWIWILEQQKELERLGF